MSRQLALKAKADMWETAARGARKHGVRMGRGLFKRLFQSSIYEPHQGPRECARRLRQVEKWILKS